MNIENITKEQLIKKLVEMHQKIIELEKYKKEYKNLESLLKENEGKYGSMLETGSVGILIVDSKGVITSCNDAVLDFSGFTISLVITVNSETTSTDLFPRLSKANPIQINSGNKSSIQLI